MILELVYVTFVTAFVALVVFGHVLLACAIYKGLRDDWAVGRGSNRKPPLPDWPSQVAAKVASENANSGGVPAFGPLPSQ